MDNNLLYSITTTVLQYSVHWAEHCSTKCVTCIINYLNLTLAIISLLSLQTSLGHLTTSILFLLLAIILLRTCDIISNSMYSSNSVLCVTLNVSSSCLLNSLLLVIEVISLVFRSLSLGFRFVANSVAGHIFVHLVSMVIIISFILPSVSLILVALTVFELIVSFIQVNVFTSLYSSYI